MPKPKPDQVVVHRIDLQPSVKESLDSFLVGKTLTNAVGAVGSLVQGLGPALGVIAGWWLADKALDTVLDEIKGWAMSTGESIVEERYESQLDLYKLVCATLESIASPEDLLNVEESMMASLNSVPGNFNPVSDAWSSFRPMLMIAISQGQGTPWDGWGKPLVQRWQTFYPVSALIQQVKADALSLGGQADKLPWPVSWGWKKLTNQ